MAAPGAPAAAPALSEPPPGGGDIAVVVVLYQGAEWIERCLSSVRSAHRRVHLIVVDNASTDDGPARVRAGFPQATLLPMRTNLGFGRGCNAGIREARERGCRHVLLLNQDAWMAPDALDRLADLLDDEAAFGAASPLHCTADFQQLDPRTTANYLRPHAMEFLSDATLAEVRRAYRVRGLNAAAWLVRMSTFERFGGFDPLFFMYARTMICWTAGSGTTSPSRWCRPRWWPTRARPQCLDPSAAGPGCGARRAC
jgi:GT2 family glycosyltransferase